LFARSTRWRQFFFAACLPYVVLSVVVESFHTSPAGRVEPVRTLVSMASNAVAATPADGPCIHAAVGDDSCAACNWLRLGRRIESGISLARTRETVVEPVAVAAALRPDSPVPHPSLFRGPPRPVLS
jgi:hypothetical protein